MSTKPLIKHYGQIANGNIVFHNKELWRQQLAMLEGKDFELTIKQKYKKPTNDQYNYYHGGILATCHQTEIFCHFDKPHDIHELYFAPKFLSKRIQVILPNERYEVVKVTSLTQLTRQEVAEFIDRVIAHCAEIGITILSPEEYYTENFSINKYEK